MRSKFLLLPLLAFSSFASAQPVAFSGPVEAFAFDLPTRSIRPIIGVPGSSSFGSAIVERLEFGSVAPEQNYAVVLQGLVWQVATNLNASRPTMHVLTGITARPQGVAWSGDGSLAVLYSFAGNWIQTVSGLPGKPVVGPHTDLSSMGALKAVAADGSGKRVALAFGGSDAGVFLVPADALSSFQPLAKLANPVALSFSSDSSELFAIDASTRQLSVIGIAAPSSRTVSLDGLADPFALRASAAGVIYIASGSDKILREYSLSSQQTIADIPLSFKPTGLDGFGRNSWMVGSRLRAGDPLWLFVYSPAAATYFVPALPQQPLHPERSPEHPHEQPEISR